MLTSVPCAECLNGKEVTAENAVSGSYIYETSGALGSPYTKQSPGKLLEYSRTDQAGTIWTIGKDIVNGVQQATATYIVYKGRGPFTFKCY